MHQDYYRLMHLISEYGKAKEAKGKAGNEPKPVIGGAGLPAGYIVMPIDNRPEHLKCCELWGQIQDLLEAHFKNHWLRTLLGLT